MHNLRLSIVAILFALTVLFTSTFAQDGDADGDGVLDSQDVCPSVQGTKENKGCPGKNADTDKKVVGQPSPTVKEIPSGLVNAQIAALTAKIAAAPQDDKLYVERSKTYWGLKKYARATADIDKALSINPNNSEAVKLQNDFLKKTYSDPTGAVAAQYAEDLKSMEAEKAAVAKCVSGNCVNGKGKYIYPNGDTYEGSFVNGKKDGQGTFTFENRDIYTGQFANDKRNGKGTSKYNNGDMYYGDWVDDKYEGQGTYASKDGSFLTGEFKNSRLNGYGREYYKPSKSLKEGSWKDGVFVGSSSAKASKTEAGWQKICEPFVGKMVNAVDTKKDDESAKNVYSDFEKETQTAGESKIVRYTRKALLRTMHQSNSYPLIKFVREKLKTLNFNEEETKDILSPKLFYV